MLNPFSWSLDGWFLFLQIIAFAILGATVAVGYFLSNRQAAEIIGLKRTLEAERTTRLELEKSLIPRHVDQFAIVDKLKPYKGIKIAIESIDDFEALRLAGQLYALTTMSGWEVVSMRPMPPSEWPITVDGVLVLAKLDTFDQRALEAGEILTDELNAQNVETKVMPEDLPPATLLIRVGLRPTTFFLPDDVKEKLKRAEAIMKEARRQRREAQEK